MGSSLERQNRYLATERGAAKRDEYRASEDGKLAAVKATSSWRQRNPEKSRAHDAVKYALRTGRLTKKPCEVCGSTKVHAHHDDYADRLNVRWLCSTHHRQHHKEND
mgnify:CR=1 FL=1